MLLSDFYPKPEASSVQAQILQAVYSDEQARLESVLLKGRLRRPSDPPSWQKTG